MRISNCGCGNAAAEKEADLSPYSVDAGKETLQQSSCRATYVYSYVLSTAGLSQDGLIQNLGCAPNMDGGIITLTTCKHLMRTLRSANQWEGVCVAGFTKRTDGKNYLYYLMRVEKAFDSFHAIWFNLSHNLSVRNAKSASHNPRGDLYEPRSFHISNVYDHANYIPPCPKHGHAGGAWINDIRYRTRAGRRPVLLAGDPECSFVWRTPMYYSKHWAANSRAARPGKSWSWADFIKDLAETA